jgi:hypothetical protein
MPRHRLLPPLLLLLALAPAGCGHGPSASDAVPGPSGAPRWRLSSEAAPDGGTALTLLVRTPLRARLRLVGLDGDPDETPWRALAAGQAVDVRWSHAFQEGDAIEERPKPSDVAAGHTEAHAATVTFAFTDWPLHVSRLLRFTRPGAASTAALDALPPGGYEDLPSQGSVELATVVLADLTSGHVTLRRRDLTCRVLAPKPPAAGDRVHVLRLFLDLAPAP